MKIGDDLELHDINNYYFFWTFMKQSYIPKATVWEFCEWLNLCSVRNRDWIIKVWVKNLVWEIREETLSTIINEETYNWTKIVRVYSSWHVFISDDRKKVFLVTIEKNWKIQHQFTWWSPLEEANFDVIFKKEGKYKFDIKKVRKNAIIRTKNRTWVDVLEEYNKKPIVDWVFIENEEDGEIYYKLVCLMHFIVKEYEGILLNTWIENTIDWRWYNIDDLQNIRNVAPNAYIVSKKAVELLVELEK